MMRIFTKSWWAIIIPIALGIIVIWVPEEVSAQNEGLIPCGGESQDPCSLCHLFILIRNIFNFALQLLASIATLSIVIGGGMMVVSNGNPSLFKQGLTAVQNAIVGILLTLAFFVFFSFGLEALGFQQQSVVLDVDGNEQGFQFQPGQFFEVTCDTADYLNNSDRSWGGGGSSGGGNNGGGSIGDVSGNIEECFNNNPELEDAIENNAYDQDPNTLAALLVGGEGCNPDVRYICNDRGWDDADCSCGFSQCTPIWRNIVFPDQSLQESCQTIQSDIQADVDCAAYAMDRMNSDTGGTCNSNVRQSASCYNTGAPDQCNIATDNYCDRVEASYDSIE